MPVSNASLTDGSAKVIGDPEVVIPFIRSLGIEFVDMENGHATLALTLEPHHLNSWGVGHGGVVMTMLDAVMSMAGRSLDPDPRSGVTIELKTSFMQPAGKEGSRLIAKGKVMHAGNSMRFCEGEVWDGDKLAAKATGTFKFRKRRDPKDEANG